MLRRHPPDQLRALLDPQLPILLLIDPLLGEPVLIPAFGNDATARREVAWQRAIAKLTLPAGIDLSANLHPYLVRLHCLDDHWIESTLDIARSEQAAARRDGLAGSGRGAHRIGGWLQSDLEPEALALALAQRMLLPRMGFTQARYLRLADRRTLDWLTVVFGEPRIAGTLGVAKRWIWLDSNGTLSEFTPEDTDADVGALHMSPQQWAEFSLAAAVHPCLARCLGHDPRPDALGSNATESLARVRDAVKQAHRERTQRPALLAGDDDLIAWAAMSLLSPGFEHRADFAAALARAAADAAVTFTTLCLELCRNTPPATNTATNTAP